MKKKTCLVLTGPTAVGKTSLAIQLAQKYNTSIISADSRQCYKEMNIGVAKPTEEQLQQVPHYFINSHSIMEEVNAGGFEQFALAAAETIFEKKDIAVMVGGTGLYIKAFCEGLDSIPSVNTDVREELVRNFELKGLNWLQQQIEEMDPQFYTEGEMKNPRRMLRALEVKLSTGNSIRAYQQGKKMARSFNCIMIGLELPKELLHQQITQRVEEMMEQGLLEEVKKLYPQHSFNALQTVGYSELFRYLDGEVSLAEAVQLIKRNTRQYAKRQITWFKKAGIEQFFDPRFPQKIFSFVEEKLHDNLI